MSVVNDDDDARIAPLPSDDDAALTALRDSAVKCRKLLRELSDTNNAAPDDADTYEAEEMMAAFNILTSSMGIFRQGQHSPASRLQNVPEVASLVRELLDTLHHHLEHALAEDQSDQRRRVHAVSSRNESVASSDRLTAALTSARGTINSLRQLSLTIRLVGAQHQSPRIQRFRSHDTDSQVFDVFRRYALRKASFMFPVAPFNHDDSGSDANPGVLGYGGGIKRARGDSDPDSDEYEMPSRLPSHDASGPAKRISVWNLAAARSAAATDEKWLDVMRHKQERRPNEPNWLEQPVVKAFSQRIGQNSVLEEEDSDTSARPVSPNNGHPSIRSAYNEETSWGEDKHGRDRGDAARGAVEAEMEMEINLRGMGGPERGGPVFANTSSCLQRPGSHFHAFGSPDYDSNPDHLRSYYPTTLEL
ncbi:hypothetical protein CPLU01_08760 [Colletotrichum plurivorum]|uniref:Uncharacterized protein n=1 Tax=Colletotrichum plurivorum TaxID=2175906 RepID=A0A8H6KAY5_9PEZI|nr:hypothetical protein CPLU01_08760 [Colletotrichum plurivorum]